MKKIVFFMMIAAMALLMMGCRQENMKEENPPAYTLVDFETQLRQDAFLAEDSMLTAVGKAVHYLDLKATESQVTFTLRAPYIYQELMDWYLLLDDMEESELENKINELLQMPAAEKKLTLDYELKEDGSVIFHYTDEYLNRASCGIREFYQYLIGLVEEEIGGADNE